MLHSWCCSRCSSPSAEEAGPLPATISVDDQLGRSAASALHISSDSGSTPSRPSAPGTCADGPVLLSAACFWATRPVYFGAYNPLFGGTPVAAKVLLVAGRGLDEIGRYVSQKRMRKRCRIRHPCHQPAPYFPGSHGLLRCPFLPRAIYSSLTSASFTQLPIRGTAPAVPQPGGNTSIPGTASRSRTSTRAPFAPYDKPTAPTLPSWIRQAVRLAVEDITTADATARASPLTGNRRPPNRLHVSCPGDRAGHRWAQTDVRPMSGSADEPWRPGAVVISDDAALERRPYAPGDYDLLPAVYALADMSVLAVSDPRRPRIPTSPTSDRARAGWTVPSRGIAVRAIPSASSCSRHRLIGFDLPSRRPVRGSTSGHPVLEAHATYLGNSSSASSCW